MTSSEQPSKRFVNMSRLVVFVILLGFWLIFSGHYDLFHVSLGILCCALVSLASHDLLIHNIRGENKLQKTGRFVLYIPWLIYQIILANIHVVGLVINPKKIYPEIIRYKSNLTSDLSKVTMANSITLTPGTITMDIDEQEFYVHAISKKVADDLLEGEMERRVAHIFFETKEDQNV